MTTADYLESLQNDLETINTSLNLDEGTNFTDIAEMAQQGVITKGGGGVDLDDYFNTEITTGTSTLAGWKQLAKKVPDNITITNGNCSYMFMGYPATTCPHLTTASGITINNCSYMFNGCLQITEIDLSSVDLSSTTNVQNMFYQCKVLEKLDIRTLDNVGNITSKNNMLYRVPSNCLIIVKDATVKAWFNSNFGSWTNVQTVAEYEAS